MEKLSSLVLMLLLLIQCFRATTGNDIKKYTGRQGSSLMIPRRPLIDFPNRLLLYIEWMTVNSISDSHPKALVRNRRVIEDIEGNLYFTSLELEDDLDGGLYKLVIFDRLTRRILEEGSYSQLTVIKDPVAGSAPKLMFPAAGAEREISEVEGKEVFLQCIFGGTSDITVQWEGPTTTGKPWASGTGLYIQTLSKEDNGNYFCTGKNKHGERKETIPLIVKSKVEITEGPSDQVLAPNIKFVEFTCEATADDDLNWDWISYGGQPLSDDRFEMEDNRLRINFEDVPFDVVETYAGRYGCNASDDYSWKLGWAKLEICRTGIELTPGFLKGFGAGAATGLVIGGLVALAIFFREEIAGIFSG